jgi:hypothetical protein
MGEATTARTYNQDHASRKYSRGHRRVSVYVAWSYPGEANRDPTVLDNRFSTMTEVRRVFWPAYEEPQWSDPSKFQQGIAGTLELFFRAWELFQDVVGEVTSHPVPMFQRWTRRASCCRSTSGSSPTRTPCSCWSRSPGLSSAASEEIEAVREFLAREGTCLVPVRTDVRRSGGKQRDIEYHHHGDARAPTTTVRRVHASVDEGLGIPVENRWGLRAVVAGKIAPLTILADLDERGWLTGVHNFPALPHYALTTEDTRSIHVLARQPIELSRPHPFTEAGNEEFNALVWMPPGDRRAGDVLVVDSTVFSTLFGSDASLDRFWKNLATR